MREQQSSGEMQSTETVKDGIGDNEEDYVVAYQRFMLGGKGGETRISVPAIKSPSGKDKDESGKESSRSKGETGRKGKLQAPSSSAVALDDGDHSEAGDDNNYLLAYQQFMLGGSSEHSRTPTSKSTPTVGKSRLEVLQKEMNRIEKRLRQLLSMFVSTLEQEWISNDDQLYSVITSIVNIRTRLPMEHKMLCSLRRERQQQSDFLLGSGFGGEIRSEAEWKQHGFRNKANDRKVSVNCAAGCLTGNDVWKTFTHDLQQHEKMVSYVRKFLLRMSEGLQTLGRHLDAAMVYQSDNMETIQEFLTIKEEEQPSPWSEQYGEWIESSFVLVNNNCIPILHILSLVELMTDVFSMLSSEMYRKQSLAQSMIDSLDGLLAGNAEVEESDRIVDPLRHHSKRGEGIASASRCCREWLRDSKYSCIDLLRFKSFLEYVTT